MGTFVWPTPWGTWSFLQLAATCHGLPGTGTQRQRPSLLFHGGQRSGIGRDKSCGPTPGSRKWGPRGRLCGGVLVRRKDLTGSSSAVSPDPEEGLCPWLQGLGPQDLPAMA